MLLSGPENCNFSCFVSKWAVSKIHSIFPPHGTKYYYKISHLIDLSHEWINQKLFILNSPLAQFSEYRTEDQRRTCWFGFKSRQFCKNSVLIFTKWKDITTPGGCCKMTLYPNELQKTIVICTSIHLWQRREWRLIMIETCIEAVWCTLCRVNRCNYT